MRGSFTMTDDEAFQRLKRLGCNYMEPCVDLHHVEKIKNNVRAKYMDDFETHLFPAEFSGEEYGQTQKLGSHAGEPGNPDGVQQIADVIGHPAPSK